jgi:hypothetical protein
MKARDSRDIGCVAVLLAALFFGLLWFLFLRGHSGEHNRDEETRKQIDINTFGTGH